MKWFAPVLLFCVFLLFTHQPAQSGYWFMDEVIIDCSVIDIDGQQHWGNKATCAPWFAVCNPYPCNAQSGGTPGQRFHAQQF